MRWAVRSNTVLMALRPDPLLGPASPEVCGLAVEGHTKLPQIACGWQSRPVFRMAVTHVLVAVAVDVVCVTVSPYADLPRLRRANLGPWVECGGLHLGPV